jgi:hypothetical protein
LSDHQPDHVVAYPPINKSWSPAVAQILPSADIKQDKVWKLPSRRIWDSNCSGIDHFTCCAMA